MNNPKINIFGTKSWYNSSNELHREDGPALEWYTGTKHWYINGKRDRKDGPAVECANGDKVWYINGKLHREDGPAIELLDGRKFWYLDGKIIDCKTQEEFEQIKKLLVFYNE